MKVIILSFVLCLASCAKNHISRTHRDSRFAVFNGTHFEEFFLPSVPSWANFSVAGKCFRDQSLSYLKFDLLAQNYELNYFDLVSLQTLYNREVERLRPDHLRKEQMSEYISPRDKSYIFHETFEKVRGGFKLALTRYPHVNLIWVDPFLDDIAHLKTRLVQLKNSAIMDKGVPVLFSLCNSSLQVESIFKNNPIDSEFNLYLGAELFHVYDDQLKIRPHFGVDLKSLYPEKKINIIVPKGMSLPSELRGEHNLFFY